MHLPTSAKRRNSNTTSVSFLAHPVVRFLFTCIAGKIQMSERTKLHLDEVAHDEFIVELRQPKVCIFSHSNAEKNCDILVRKCDISPDSYARASLVFYRYML